MTIGILDLPNEILRNILDILSYPSILAIKWTCRTLYSQIEPLTVYGMADLLEIELWPVFNAAEYRPEGLKRAFPQYDFFACHICLKIKGAECFSNAMMKGKRGKFASGSSINRVTRFCISCGIDTGRYQPGLQFDYGGGGRLHGVLCRKCGKFKYFSGTSRLGFCRDCLSRENLLERESVTYL
ncbi:hypothetical protein TWF694_005429 [Orbilia ellipsospora]|uniref:F-box domain-containing protein n=1 Tax=Orbilia ellipsospora TaxID=2528407 RepID=A0AAV9WT18_9PEZI